ncbi:unnamed protein product [Notodromas monacha]|uniref:Phosphatidic acid phosphatase type 2/haloperoxidase domain-containing protein n=1 Tax=Notodromas monacha TaxID=399045 RepID=A0A7R9BM72_9CRUS|nr:unnamed protein product [Notodromas monacha]CAG0918075.1 unnamed protein product [Notodromas monacha]
MRRTAGRVLGDGAVMSVLAVILAYYSFVPDPVKRGFFCHDEHLNYPYVESTVPSMKLYVAATVIPFVVVAIFEWLHASAAKTVRRQYVQRIYIYFVVWFTFGALITSVITQALKISVGRLRPHFFTVCAPDFVSLEPLCARGIYVTEYNCTREMSEMKSREIRVSFPSAHSSYGFHAAVFLILYLQIRSVLLKPLLQISFIGAAAMVGVSRVGDYKHFPSDVLAGAFIGTICAFFSWIAVTPVRLYEVYCPRFSCDEEEGLCRPMEGIEFSRRTQKYNTFFSTGADRFVKSYFACRMKEPFLRRAFVDWSVLIAGIIVVCMYSYVGFPVTQNGFICGDKSLMFPYLDSTVPSSVMYSTSVLVPVFGLVVVELFVKRELSEFYEKMVRFGFGAILTQLMVDFGKFYLGALRPHFLTVCQPQTPDNSSSLDCIPGSYVDSDSYVCRKDLLLYSNEARLSFPSSHAAFTFHAAVFLVLYLEMDLPAAKGYVVRGRWRRWAWWRAVDGTVLIIPLLQVILLLASTFVSASRIIDFKHDAIDVTFSAVIGALVAIVTYFGAWTQSPLRVSQAFSKSDSGRYWNYDELIP